MPTFKHLDRVTALRSGINPGRISLMHVDAAVLAFVVDVLVHSGCEDVADNERAYEVGIELLAVLERDGVNLHSLIDGR